MSITGTNIEVTNTASLPCSSTNTGKTCLDYDMLLSIIKQIDGSIAVEIANDRAVIKSSTGEYVIPSFDYALFPIPNVDACDFFAEVDSEVFATAMRSSNVGCIVDAFKPLISGVFVYISDGKLVTCGANHLGASIFTIDGKYAQITDSFNKDGLFFHKNIITPILSLIGLNTTISCNNSFVKFESGNRVVITQRSHSTYVPLSLFFRFENTVMCSVNKHALVDSISRLCAVSSDDSKRIEMTFGDELGIVAEDIIYNMRGSEKIPSTPTSPLTVGISASWAKTLLSVRTCSELRIAASTEMNAVYFQGDDNIVTLLMPIAKL